MENICHACNLNKIEMKKRPLCRPCFKKNHITHSLEDFPIFNKREITIKRALRKHGSQFLIDMEILHNGECTLSKVGTTYGVTGEAIRQIYKRIYGGQYTDIVRKRKQAGIDKLEISKREHYPIEYKLKNFKENSSVFKGIMAEYLFYNKCSELGHNISLRGQGKHIYDADVNGLKVKIKSTNCILIIQQKEYYRVNLNHKQLNILDFVAIFIALEDFWYILPKQELKSISIYLPIMEKRKGSKFQSLQKYRNAWELLENKNN